MNDIVKPVWLKVVNIIAVLLLIAGIIVTILLFWSGDSMGAVFGVLLLSIPLIGTSLLLFVFNILYSLKIKNNKKAGNLILIPLFAIFLIVLIISFLGYLHIAPFERWDIAGWFLLPFQFVIVVIFSIYLYFLNKKLISY